MIGESSEWVIGETKDLRFLETKTATFNFVITSPQPFTSTNITVQVSFNHIFLEGGDAT